MFGDNDSGVNSSMNSHGKTNKRHVALSFNRVREAIAAEIVAYHFITGKINPADVLSNHWAHHSVWITSKPFFCFGKEILWSFSITMLWSLKSRVGIFLLCFYVLCFMFYV